MASYNFFFFVMSFILMQLLAAINGATFDQNYYAYWGLNHFKLVEPQDEVQLLLDQSSGSGFKSRSEYESGLFRIKMKIPEQKTGGIIPNFYLISNFDSGRDELDFEFMGSKGLLQTNIYTGGLGGREQRLQLPFDPSQDFHTYTILWNQHQIVFFVDDIPVRVFKNETNKGVKYPTKAMHIEGTIWYGDWAGEVDWKLSPFIVHYKDFNNITACSASQFPGAGQCYSSSSGFFWNLPPFLELNNQQKHNLEMVQKSWLVYDYCKSSNINLKIYPECSMT